jgi:cytochrome c1
MAILLATLAAHVAVASDRVTLRRGLQVHIEVCAACHGIAGLRFADLALAGGPELARDDIVAIAGRFQVRIGEDAHKRPLYRPAMPEDTLPLPFATPSEARRAFAGLLPVDLATLGRSHWGEEERRQFLLALLLGYRDAPPDRKLPPDRYYNVGAPGQSTGMPPPLANGMVAYWDQSPATVEQYAADVTAFLLWAASVTGTRR